MDSEKEFIRQCALLAHGSRFLYYYCKTSLYYTSLTLSDISFNRCALFFMNRRAVCDGEYYCERTVRKEKDSKNICIQFFTTNLYSFETPTVYPI